MNKRTVKILGVTLVGCLALYPACIYSNWRFRDTNPFTEILTYFYELQGEVKALNTSFLDLESYLMTRMNTSETTVVDLQSRVEALENKSDLHSTFEWGGRIDILGYGTKWVINETRGYERVTLGFRVTDGGNCDITIFFKTSTPYDIQIENFNLAIGDSAYRTYLVQGSSIKVRLYSTSASSVTIYVSIYATT